jgi:hypothetical protein
MPQLPARVHNLPAARAQFGDLVDRLLPALHRGDPLADAAVEFLADRPDAGRLVDAALDEPQAAPDPLAAMLVPVAGIPEWADCSRVDRACHLFLRAGVVGGFVLGLRSLVHGYAAPAGNKPLAFSGQLRERAPRRLAETARFVAAVCEPGGLLPGGEGRKIALKVRLMHAQVRRLLLRSGRWNDAAWALPINQHDMIGTNLLFSHIFLDGLRLLGLHVGPEEADDYIHLWKFAGWLLGVETELLPDREHGARELAECIYLTQGPPDADSRALTAALLHSPVQVAATPMQRRLAAARVRLSHALCRHLIGNDLADALGVPQADSFAVPLLVDLLGGLDRVRQVYPPAEAAAERFGRRYWQFVIDVGLGGGPATFSMPDRLSRSPRAT